MLTQVEARSSQGTSLMLPLEDISNGFALEDVGGLDPVKATIVSTKFAQIDGAQPQSSSRETRNITMKISLQPDYAVETVQDLRDHLYDFFMPKEFVDLHLYDHAGRVVNATGQVESCVAPLFVKDPEVNISIICFDPDFVELDTVDLSGSTVADTTETLVSYIGTSQTGMQFVMHVNRTMSGFTIYNRLPGNTLQTLDVAYPLVSGDELTINTMPGSKGATLVRGGVTSQPLYSVSPQADWTFFKRGDNYIRVHASGAAVPFDISYYNRYGGL
jgi:Phage tail protein